MSLSITDQAKVMKAGFRIFRVDPIRKQITEAKSPGGWGPHSNYKTKVELHCAWNKLMQEDKNIAG